MCKKFEEIIKEKTEEITITKEDISIKKLKRN